MITIILLVTVSWLIICGFIGIVARFKICARCTYALVIYDPYV